MLITLSPELANACVDVYWHFKSLTVEFLRQKYVVRHTSEDFFGKLVQQNT